MVALAGMEQDNPERRDAAKYLNKAEIFTQSDCPHRGKATVGC